MIEFRGLEIGKEFSTTEKITDFWNKFSDKYTENVEPHTAPVGASLFALVNGHKSESVLETGVGTGISSHMFVTSQMKQGAVYVGTDISENMITK